MGILTPSWYGTLERCRKSTVTVSTHRHHTARPPPRLTLLAQREKMLRRYAECRGDKTRQSPHFKFLEVFLEHRQENPIFLGVSNYPASAFHSMAPYGGPLILLLLWSCWGWLLLGPRCFTAQITNMSSVVPSSSAPRSFTLPQCGTCPSIILRVQTSFLFRIGLGIWNLEFSCLRVSF